MTYNADCHFGDHNWQGAFCSHCGEENFAQLGYYGARARWAKEWGITVEEVDARWEAKAMAELEAMERADA